MGVNMEEHVESRMRHVPEEGALSTYAQAQIDELLVKMHETSDPDELVAMAERLKALAQQPASGQSTFTEDELPEWAIHGEEDQEGLAAFFNAPADRGRAESAFSIPRGQAGVVPESGSSIVVPTEPAEPAMEDASSSAADDEESVAEDNASNVSAPAHAAAAEVEPETESELEPEPEAEPEAEPELESELESESDSEPAPQPEVVESGFESELAGEVESDPQPETEHEAEPKHEPELEVVPEPETQTASEPELGPQPASEPQSTPVTEAAPAADVKPQPEAASDSQGDDFATFHCVYMSADGQLALYEDETGHLTAVNTNRFA